jgi:hypothetical protein
MNQKTTLSHYVKTGELQIFARHTYEKLFDGTVPDIYLARQIESAVRDAEQAGYRHGLEVAKKAFDGIKISL